MKWARILAAAPLAALFGLCTGATAHAPAPADVAAVQNATAHPATKGTAPAPGGVRAESIARLGRVPRGRILRRGGARCQFAIRKRAGSRAYAVRL